MEFPRIDDEHNLIARYAATLLSYETTSSDRDQQQNLANSLTSSSDSFQLTTEFKDHQNLINELEASNRQIMEEIQHLRQAKDGSFSNSNLIFELQMLKQHKGELEGRMNKLQDGRRDLIEQLEGLMGLLKSRDGAKNSQHSSPLHKVASLHHRELGHSPRHDKMYANGSASASPKLTPQHSISSTSSSVYSSRTKRQFSELFTAADAINDALSHLVNHVTTDEDTDSSPCAAFPTSHSDFDTVEY
ncbi:dystrobrevin beta-like [Watersipora subatra]|uniref:dystrobrevin beta-like n=1 Tax=Watersipora subatra TaxID=2589382 RepID=UPI00355C8617